MGRAAGGSELVIEGLEKSYQLKGATFTALEEVNLTVGAGEFISIVGSSGCGKSTLLRIIAGLENGYRGSVTLGGKRIRGPGLDRGMVFQEHRLIPWLSVQQNVAFAIRGETGAETARRVDEQLRLVGLSGFARAFPGQLSGGMAQRVAIARALVNSPGLLLLDEPFAALDALSKITLQQEVIRIRELERSTTVLVTHDIDEAIYLGDRVVIMSPRPGRIKRIVPVPLPRPRDRSSFEFVQIRKEIYHEFFNQAQGQFSYVI